MKQRYFTEEHQWIEVSQEMAELGITRLGEAMLGDLVFVQPIEIATPITKGSPLLTLESVKTAYEIYAPISGEVIEFNTSLSINPELLNQEPNDTWIVRIRAIDIEHLGKEIEQLLSADDYKAISG